MGYRLRWLVGHAQGHHVHYPMIIAVRNGAGAAPLQRIAIRSLLGRLHAAVKHLRLQVPLSYLPRQPLRRSSLSGRILPQSSPLRRLPMVAKEHGQRGMEMV